MAKTEEELKFEESLTDEEYECIKLRNDFMDNTKEMLKDYKAAHKALDQKGVAFIRVCEDSEGCVPCLTSTHLLSGPGGQRLLTLTERINVAMQRLLQ